MITRWIELTEQMDTATAQDVLRVAINDKTGFTCLPEWTSNCNPRLYSECDKLFGTAVKFNRGFGGGFVIQMLDREKAIQILGE
jgi:hypothetical protein